MTQEPTNGELAEALRSIEGLPLGTQLVVRLAADRLCADGDGWIEWGGGECPVQDGVLVEVKYRDGKQTPFRMPSVGEAGDYDWSDGDRCADIVAYRIIKGAP